MEKVQTLDPHPESSSSLLSSDTSIMVDEARGSTLRLRLCRDPWMAVDDAMGSR